MEEQKRVKDIQAYCGYLESERKYWDTGIWQDIADYVTPIREDLQGNQPQGTIQGTKAYDGTAIYAVNLAADGTHGYMYDPASMWFDMRLPRQLRHIEKESSVRNYFEDMKSVGYSALQDSNFYTEMRTFLKDFFGIGTATMLPEEDLQNNKICCHTLHPREGYIAEDMYGNVDTFFRKIKLTARQAFEKFDKEKLSDPIKNCLRDSGNPYTQFDFIHAVFPRKDFDSRKLSSTNKKYASIWIEAGGKKILKEGGYDLFPYMVARYSKSGNEVYGRSPAAFALPEIKALNVISKGLLGATQRSVQPSWMIPVEMKNKARLTPDGMNYYGGDYNRRIYPVNSNINFPAGLDREQAKQEIIEKHFHVDFFLMLQRAEREMTAREIIERMGEKASVMAASLGSLMGMTDNFLDYVFYIEEKAGRTPPVPDILRQYGGAKIDIVYTGQLAQAQKRLFETQGIRLGLELAAPIFQIMPDTLDNINWDDTAVQLLKSNGFPQSVLNDPKTIQDIRQGRQQQQAADKQKVDSDIVAETIKKLSQAAKNSPQFAAQIQALAEGMGGGQDMSQGMVGGDA